MRSKFGISVMATVMLGLSACGGGGGGGGSSTAALKYDPVIAAAVVANYAELVHSMYADNVNLAQNLHDKIVDFVNAPDATKFQACKDAWIAARPFYIQIEYTRFSEGPIDRDVDGVEGFMNAWPLDEVYIDYVNGSPNAGIINDPAGFPTIDEATLRGANENGGEANISTGWHAIEFLLWGQDLVLGAGGGVRSHTDFVDAGGSASNESRRRDYLRVCAEMLVEDLTFLRDEWAAGNPNNYRAEFTSLPVETALARLMTGMGTLAVGELRGERILVPFTTKDKEDEHSCFSDNTHVDHKNDAIGIRNAWLGSYTSSDGSFDVAGSGLSDLAVDADSAKADAVNTALNAAITSLENPILNPFEVAIQGVDTDPGRATLIEAMAHLQEFGDAFAELAAAMEIDAQIQ